ncbi:MAG: UDP-N-acetylmuramate dehydrogenase [Chlamydiota bacterium]
MMLKIRENILLNKYATLGIGGPAKYFVEVKTIQEMVDVIKLCKEHTHHFIVIGKGSNILFDDRGFHGVVILNKIDFFEDNKQGEFHVGAGYSFSLLGSKTARKGWSGLEFASGIPGTVGGAVFMNAGANGTETMETLKSVDFVNSEGDFVTMEKKEITFKYRYSSFHDWGGAIVGATFSLEPSDVARKRQIEIIEYRTKTQPYGEKSAGCIFRNPAGAHAGQLIEKSGLKGSRIGGAEVSGLHANFIVNTEGASASDVLQLIEHVKSHVKETMNIELQDEVRVISYDKDQS